MIPDEAVEAVADIIVQGARAACECRHSIFDKHDVNPPCSARREAMRVARIAIEVAARNTLAEAWDDGARADHDWDGEVTTRNPYRTTQ